MSLSTRCSVNSQSSSSYEHQLRQPHFAEGDENPVRSAAKNIGVECRSSSSSSSSSSLIGRVRRSPSPESERPTKRASSSLQHANTASWESILEASHRGDLHFLIPYQTEPESFWLGLRDDEDRSTLHLAIKHGHKELAQWLVERCPALMYLEDSSGYLPGDYSKDHVFIQDLLDRIIPGEENGCHVSKGLKQLAFLCRLSNKGLALDYCIRLTAGSGSSAEQMDIARKIPRVLQDHSSGTHPFEVCAELGKGALAVELIDIIERPLSKDEAIGPFWVACISRAKTLVKWLLKNGHSGLNRFHMDQLEDDRVTSRLIAINGSHDDCLLQYRLAWVCALGLMDEGKELLENLVEIILKNTNAKPINFKNAEEMKIAYCLITIPDHPLTKEVMNDLKRLDRCRYLKSLIDIMKILVQKYNKPPILNELKMTLANELQEHLEKHPGDFLRLHADALVSSLLFLDCDSLAKQVFNCYNRIRGKCLIELLLQGIIKYRLDNSQGWACFKKLVEIAKAHQVDCSLTGYGTTISIVHFLAKSDAENTVEILEWLHEKFPKEAQALARSYDSFDYECKYALELVLENSQGDFLKQARIVKTLLRMGGQEILEHVVKRKNKAVKLKILLLLAGGVEIHRAVDLTSFAWREEDIERALESLPPPIRVTKEGVRALFHHLGDGKISWLRFDHLRSLLVYTLAVVEKPEDLTLVDSFLQLKSANPAAVQTFWVEDIVTQTFAQWETGSLSEKHQDTLIEALNTLKNAIDLKESKVYDPPLSEFHDVSAPKVWYWWVTQYTHYYPTRSRSYSLGSNYRKIVARLRKETIAQLIQNYGAEKKGKSYFWSEGGMHFEFIPCRSEICIVNGTRIKGHYTYQGIRRWIEENLKDIEGNKIQEKIPAKYWLKDSEEVTGPDFFDRPGCLIPKVLFKTKYEELRKGKTITRGKANAIQAYRIDPITGHLEERTFPFQRGLESVLKQYIDETHFRIEGCVEELKRAGIPVIFPATQDEINNRRQRMKSGEIQMFIDPIGRTKTVCVAFPQLHEIYSRGKYWVYPGIGTVMLAQSQLEGFQKLLEDAGNMQRDFEHLKGFFLQKSLLRHRAPKFWEYYVTACNNICINNNRNFVVVPLPPGEENVMVVSKDHLGVVCFKDQVIHASRELLAISEALAKGYRIHPAAQRIQFDKHNNVIHEQPADIDLDDVIEYFDTEYVKKYPQAADRKKALQLFIANIKAGKGIPGIDPKKNAPDYRKMLIQLTHTLVKLRDEKKTEEFESLVGELVRFNPELCSQGVGTEIQLRYQLAFGLLDQKKESKDAPESVFNEESLEAVFKCHYENALSETIDKLKTNALDPHDREQTVHVKNHLRKTIGEIGFSVPSDRQELDMHDCFAEDYKKDFPKHSLKVVFKAFLLPIMVQKVMEYQESALKDKKYKRVNDQLDALYDSLKGLYLLEPKTYVEIKRNEENRDNQLNRLIREIHCMEMLIRDAKSSEIWRRIEEARKKEQSLEVSIKDNARKALHLTTTRELLEAKLAANDGSQESEEPSRKRRKVAVKCGRFEPPSQENVCKARIDILGQRIKRLQDEGEALSLQKKQVGNEVNVLQSQDRDFVGFEKTLADLKEKRSDVGTRFAQNIRTLIEGKAEELQYVEMDPDLMIYRLTHKGAVLLLERFSYLQPSKREQEERMLCQKEVERQWMDLFTPKLENHDSSGLLSHGMSSFGPQMEDDVGPVGVFSLPDADTFGGWDLMKDEDNEGHG